jgi:acyl dehydratase
MIRSGTGAEPDLYFQDIVVGTGYDLGVVTVDRDEMLAFAHRFDPQWYHVDADLARSGEYGEVIASGFFTAGLFMRAYVDGFLSRAAGNASPGLEELRWLRPVYAGDSLRVRLDVLGAEESRSRPGYGTLRLQATMTRVGSDRDRPEWDVLRTTFRGWFALRPTA